MADGDLIVCFSIALGRDSISKGVRK
jgi:hypothetical protein